MIAGYPTKAYRNASDKIMMIAPQVLTLAADFFSEPTVEAAAAGRYTVCCGCA